ncbi:hypothetical protein BH23ACT11_BH23ACT11_07310 [soil metagenome]
MADRAEKVLKIAERGEIVGRVHSVVVAEVVWILQSFYAQSKEEIAGALVPLLTGHGLRIENQAIVTRALEVMVEANVDFADALLAETARAKGDGVASFDQDFGKLNVSMYTL